MPAKCIHCGRKSDPIKHRGFCPYCKKMLAEVGRNLKDNNRIDKEDSGDWLGLIELCAKIMANFISIAKGVASVLGLYSIASNLFRDIWYYGKLGFGSQDQLRKSSKEIGTTNIMAARIVCIFVFLFCLSCPITIIVALITGGVNPTAKQDTFKVHDNQSQKR